MSTKDWIIASESSKYYEKYYVLVDSIKIVVWKQAYIFRNDMSWKA